MWRPNVTVQIAPARQRLRAAHFTRSDKDLWARRERSGFAAKRVESDPPRCQEIGFSGRRPLGRRPIDTVHLVRLAGRGTTPLGVYANHFDYVQKYGLNLNSPDPPERCVDLLARPADLLAGKTVLRNPAKALQKELPMSGLWLTFGGDGHNARQASTERTPINTVTSHSRLSFLVRAPSLRARAP